MSTLTSASTFAEVVAAYDDNASWEEDSNATKAAAFITACRFLLRYAAKQSKGGQGVNASQEFDYEVIRAEMEAARSFAASQSSGSTSNPNVLHADWSGLRI